MKKKDLTEIDWDYIQEIHNNGVYYYNIPQECDISIKVLNRAVKEGFFIKKKHKRKHTKETKKKISEKKIEYLKNNPDKHPWKNHNKFKSVPCEKFKKMLTENKISFVPEYSPLEDRNYSVDVAFPDKKIVIEINGNQHYNNKGTLKPYYQQRHDEIVNAGWKIFEIHFSLVYNCELVEEFIKKIKKDFHLENVDYSSFKLKKKKIPKYGNMKDYQNARKIKEVEKNKNRIKKIMNSDIDFSRFGWTSKVSKLINMISSKINSWMIKNMRDFYEQKCYKKNYNKNFCLCGKQIQKTSKLCKKCSNEKIKKMPSETQLKKDIQNLTIQEICKKYNIHRSRFYKWKKIINKN